MSSRRRLGLPLRVQTDKIKRRWPETDGDVLTRAGALAPALSSLRLLLD